MTEEHLYDYRIGQFSVSREGFFSWTAHWNDTISVLGGGTLGLELSISGFMFRRTALATAKKRANEALASHQKSVLAHIEATNAKAEAELKSDD